MTDFTTLTEDQLEWVTLRMKWWINGETAEELGKMRKIRNKIGEEAIVEASAYYRKIKGLQRAD